MAYTKKHCSNHLINKVMTNNLLVVTIGYRVTFHNIDPIVAKNVTNDNGIWRSRLCLGFRGGKAFPIGVGGK